MPPGENTPQATYLIQYPNARVELLASSVMKVLQLLLDEPQAPSEDDARAASIYLDAVILPMAVWTSAVEQAIEEHHPDPAGWTVPDSQKRLATDIGDLTLRYERLMTGSFPNLDRRKPPGERVIQTLDLYQDIALGHAAERMNGEIISRPANDPTGKACRRALHDHARELHSHKPDMSVPEDHPLSGQARQARAATARILPSMHVPETDAE